MRRHEADLVSLVAGLLFLLVAVVHIAARSSDTDLSVRWMVPAVLVLLGVLGLLSAVRSPHSERRVSADADWGTQANRPDEASKVAEAGETSEVDEADEVTEVEPKATDR